MKPTAATATTTPAPSAQTEPNLTTKHVAAKFGLKPIQLRRVLRSMAEYADGVHTNYRWTDKDPMLPKIEAAIKARAAQRAASKEEAKDKLLKQAAVLATPEVKAKK